MALHIDHITLQGPHLAAGTLDGAYPLELCQTETTLEVRISGESWLAWIIADHDAIDMSTVRGLIYAGIAFYREAARNSVRSPQAFRLTA